MTKSKIIKEEQITSYPVSKGYHAMCYDHPTNPRKVLLKTRCEVRKHMARKDLPNSSYFPNVRKVGTTQFRSIYEMDKYIHIDDTNSYKLSKLDHKIYTYLTNEFNGSKDDISKSKVLPQHIKKLLLTSYAILKRQKYDVCFDITDKNIMMTKSGRLILNDIFWIE